MYPLVKSAFQNSVSYMLQNRQHVLYGQVSRHFLLWFFWHFKYKVTV